MQVELDVRDLRFRTRDKNFAGSQLASEVPRSVSCVSLASLCERFTRFPAGPSGMQWEPRISVGSSLTVRDCVFHAPMSVTRRADSHDHRLERSCTVVGTTPTASAAATASWRVPGTCRLPNGTHTPRRSRSVRTAPTAPLSRRRSPSTGSRCPSMRPNSSPTLWRFQPASRRAPPTPCATAPARKCWRSRISASPNGPTGTSTTSTERRSSVGRACCTCRPCRSRNSAFRRTARSPFPPSPRRRSAPCLPR